LCALVMTWSTTQSNTKVKTYKFILFQQSQQI
jgi:hypothetical protein